VSNACANNNHSLQQAVDPCCGCENKPIVAAYCKPCNSNHYQDYAASQKKAHRSSPTCALALRGRIPLSDVLTNYNTATESRDK
jgi:hypothetical protein